MILACLAIGCGGKTQEPLAHAPPPFADSGASIGTNEPGTGGTSSKPPPDVTTGGPTATAGSDAAPIGNPTDLDASASVDSALTDGAPVIVSIAITASPSACSDGGKINFKALATLSDDSQEVVTSRVKWDSSAPLVALFPSQYLDTVGITENVATCLVHGTTVISAALGNVRAELSWQNEGVALKDYVLVAPPVMNPGAMERVVLVARYQDGSTLELTTFAAIDATGPIKVEHTTPYLVQLTALGAGSSTLTAKVARMVIATTPVVISDATLQRITITPAQPVIDLPDPYQLTAVGTYSDGAEFDISLSATWSPPSNLLARVSGGRVIPESWGTVTISASLDGVTGAVDATLRPGKVDSLLIGGVTPSKGGSTQLFAWAVYPGGWSVKVADVLTWVSTDPYVASFSASTPGLLIANHPGTTIYYATYGSLTSNLQNLEILP